MVLAVAIMLLPSESCAQRRSIERDFLPDSLSRTYRHTEAIKRLIIDGDTVGARQIWSEIVASDSTYAPALYYLSVVEPRQGLDYARRAYMADSSNVAYTHNYAMQLVQLGRNVHATEVFNRLAQLTPHDIEPYYALAILYTHRDMPYSALTILDTAEVKVGSNGHLMHIKQELLLATRQYERAIESGVRATQEHPYDAQLRISLATAYEAAGRDSSALATLEEAFVLDTANIDIISALSHYHERRGNMERSFDYEERLFASDDISLEDKIHRLDLFQRNTSLYRAYFSRIGTIVHTLAIDYPNERAVIDAYANHQIASGNAPLALEYLRHHLDDENTRAIDYVYTMELEYMMERFEELEIDATKALERYPEDFDIASYVGIIYSMLGRYSEALDILEQACKLSLDDQQQSLIYGYIGDTHYVVGRRNKAFKAYRRALEYDPDNASVLNNYAYYLLEHGKASEEVLNMAIHAVELEPDNANFIDTKAWAHYCLGQYVEAKEVMRKALSIDGQRSPEYLLHYGDILYALGEEFMAETYWQKAVQRGYDRDIMQQHINELKGYK